jgi:6-pyruvoyl-tetrahydropterin synthase
MYTVTVEGQFLATHRVLLPDGTWEPAHEHTWQVRASFGAEELDAYGQVIDFGEAKAALGSVLAELNRTNLNENDGIGGVCPSAELVARFVFQQLRGRGLVRLRRVEVTEAPGCVATFEVD